MRVIDRVKRIKDEDAATPIERHLAKEYLILAERVRQIRDVASEAMAHDKSLTTAHGEWSRLLRRLQAVENLTNSSFYRDWDR
jgi:hypothetical protein